jgi:DNA repair protein RecN (Recombination protein N)
VEGELGSLAMQNTVFQIKLQKTDWSERGADAIEFLISPNAGEEPRPLGRIASGGELSRIALALKTCLRQPPASGAPRTLVFDEIDTGIGGAVAESVGRRLKQLAASNQVLCVTHLAQVAGFADHHYVVGKHEVKGRTVAEIEELSPALRKREIGRMLSGEKVTPEALKQAEQLMRLANE